MSLERLDYPRTLYSTSIGHLALETLSNTELASVVGNTSKGIYLKISNKWLNFISFEPYNSPLTIVLNEGNTYLQNLSVGTPLQVVRGNLVVPEMGLTIIIRDSRVWYTPPPTAYPVSRSELRSTVEAFLEEVMTRYEVEGLHYLLPVLHNESVQRPPGIKIHNLSLDAISILKEYLVQRNTEMLHRTLSGYLGVGGGLTPSGDDFLVGLLLSLNRWKDMLWYGEGLLETNAFITKAAYQQTTTISANLIECATIGEADQRLIAVLDCLMTQEPCTAEIISNLLDWGHSSGVDTLLGMLTALSLYYTQ